MSRPADDEYYDDDRTEHVAQGDIFRAVPFHFPIPEPGQETEQKGRRRPVEEPPYFEGHGMLIHYTSGFMAQPPATQGYAHRYRLIAPIFPFTMLLELGMAEEALEEMRRSDKIASYMYLPPYPDEFEESAVLPYRPVLLHHSFLEGKRVTQLRGPAAVQLQLKLATTFLGGKWDPEDLEPDLTDHWHPDG